MPNVWKEMNATKTPFLLLLGAVLIVVGEQNKRPYSCDVVFQGNRSPFTEKSCSVG